ATSAATRTPTSSTSTARTSSTSRSGTGCTTASVPTWPDSKARSRSTSSSTGSPSGTWISRTRSWRQHRPCAAGSGCRWWSVEVAMPAKTLRVVQWTTGNVGRQAVGAVMARPDLELVGVYAHDPAKVGRDAAELCGLDEPTGVLATADVDELF